MNTKPQADEPVISVAEEPYPIAWRDSPASPVDCPYCGKQHEHTEGDGHRMAHCDKPGSIRGYDVRTRMVLGTPNGNKYLVEGVPMKIEEAPKTKPQEQKIRIELDPVEPAEVPYTLPELLQEAKTCAITAGWEHPVEGVSVLSRGLRAVVEFLERVGRPPVITYPKAGEKPSKEEIEKLTKAIKDGSNFAFSSVSKWDAKQPETMEEMYGRLRDHAHRNGKEYPNAICFDCGCGLYVTYEQRLLNVKITCPDCANKDFRKATPEGSVSVPEGKVSAVFKTYRMTVDAGGFSTWNPDAVSALMAAGAKYVRFVNKTGKPIEARISVNDEVALFELLETQSAEQRVAASTGVPQDILDKSDEPHYSDNVYGKSILHTVDHQRQEERARLCNLIESICNQAKEAVMRGQRVAVAHRIGTTPVDGTFGEYGNAIIDAIYNGGLTATITVDPLPHLAG